MDSRATSGHGGRPLGFDPDAALDAAMRVFWTHGYDATTTTMLERATSLSRSSLTNTFGTKEQLLLAVVDRYQSALERDLLDPLESGDGLAAIDRFFEHLGRLKQSEPGASGCLIVNLSAQPSPTTPAVQERIDRYRTRLRAAMLTAVERAATAGRLETEDAAGLADLLTGLAVAVNWTARAAGPGPAQELAYSARRLVQQQSGPTRPAASSAGPRPARHNRSRRT